MSSSSSDTPVNFQQHTLDYYKSTADDDAAILEANREARREDARRKKDEKKFRKMFGDWRPGDAYKLRNPTKVSAYRASGSFLDKLDDFTYFLDASLRLAAQKEDTEDIGEGFGDQRAISKSNSGSPFVSNPMFAPPVMDKPDSAPSSPPPTVSMHVDSEPMDSMPSGAMVLDSVAQSTSEAPAPPPPAAPVAPSAEEFQKRLALARKLAAQIPQNSPPPPPPPPPAPPVELLQPQSAVPPPPEPTPYNPTIAAPPVRYNATISAAPVHYARPPPDAPQEADDDDERPAKKQRTKAPPKMSKAALMMAKMGYVKGQGLGKNSDGVTTHLEVKARKDTGNRQVPMHDDFESDGRTIKAQQVFDITGGHRATAKDHGPFGEPSRVIVAWGCVDGIDLATDADRDDGGIRQEMGDAFNNKVYGESQYHLPNANAL
jgi:splicing factor 45